MFHIKFKWPLKFTFSTVRPSRFPLLFCVFRAGRQTIGEDRRREGRRTGEEGRKKSDKVQLPSSGSGSSSSSFLHPLRFPRDIYKSLRFHTKSILGVQNHVPLEKYVAMFEIQEKTVCVLVSILILILVFVHGSCSKWFFFPLAVTRSWDRKSAVSQSVSPLFGVSCKVCN